MGNKVKPGVWKAAFLIVMLILQPDQLLMISLQFPYSSSQHYYQEKSKLPREDNKYFQKSLVPIILKSEPTPRKVQSLGGLNAFRHTGKQGVAGKAFQHFLDKRRISVVNSKNAPLETSPHNFS